MIIAIGGLTLDVYFTYKENREKDIQQAQTQLSLDKERLLNGSCVSLRDSLKRENARLSIYKALTKAMVLRDEALSTLPYHQGDAVRLKRDSSRAVIQDVIFGGSKYNYYIRYVVQFKDKQIEEVDPQLVY